MSSANYGEQRSPGVRRNVRLGRAPRRSRMLVTLCLALAGLAAFAGSALALPVTLGGNPLTVNVDQLGQCQTSYSLSGGNFFPGDSSTGDCGFFIATPSSPTSGSHPQPEDLRGEETNPGSFTGRVFGFNGFAGPHGITNYTPISNGPATGSGSSADPFKLVTVYNVNDSTVHSGETYNAVLQITQTSTYVTGNPYFTANYTVKNVTNTLPNSDPDHNSTIYYRAIYAGDLYVNGNDHGTGVYLAGPPRFVGGQNQTSGVIGGFQENLTALDGSATPAWTSYAEDYWDTTENGEGGIWHDVENSANISNAFPDSVSPIDQDNGAGVAWDTDYTTGLAAGAEQKFSIVNITTIPSTLQVNPVSQGAPQGGTATVTVTALNSGGQPYANTPLRYTITGSNPGSGAVSTNAQGVAQIHDTGAVAGVDQIAMYLDLGNSGSQTASDPTGGAQVTFVPVPPNSTVTIQKVTVNPNGTVTITYVPSDPGQGTLSVTVPTASVAKKAKKCKKGYIKLKGKCLPATSVIGAVSGQGTPGVPLTLTVKPNAKATKALKKGRSLHVVATLTYQSAKGGAPSVHVYHLTLKPKKTKHKKAHKK
jgi:hypothetical protein